MIEPSRVLAVVRRNPGLRTQDVAQEIGHMQSPVYAFLVKLREQGYVRQDTLGAWHPTQRQLGGL